MDNGRSGFVVILLGDPPLLEGGVGGQHGSSDPGGEFSVRRTDDLDPKAPRGRTEPFHLLLYPANNVEVHGAAT